MDRFILYRVTTTGENLIGTTSDKKEAASMLARAANPSRFAVAILDIETLERYSQEEVCGSGHEFWAEIN
jgi:hypothetical protein